MSHLGIPLPIFDQREDEQRIERIKERMQNKYQDKLVTSNLSKMNYHTQQNRTTFGDDPPEVIQLIADMAVKGMEAALHIVEPGVTCEVVEKV